MEQSRDMEQSREGGFFALVAFLVVAAIFVALLAGGAVGGA